MRPVLYRFDRGLGESLGIDVPLVGQPRLDDRARAVAVGHGVDVRLHLFDQALGLQIGEHARTRLHPVEAAIGLRRGVVDPGLGVEHVDDVEVVAAAHLEIVEVVGRGDLHRAGPLFGIGVFVGDDGQASADKRQQGVAADEVAITLVLRMHGDGGIAQHGLGPGRGDDDVLAWPSCDGIAYVPELAVPHLARLDLQIGDRGAQHRVPVDQALVAIDEALAVEGDEHLDHRQAQALVHGEALPGPVGGGAEAAELAPDRAARFRLPGPHPLDERLAAEGTAFRPLLRQLALDHHLRRDPRMVHARLPERVAPGLAAIAGEHVLQRVVERMPHVQAAGDVGRRHHHAPRRALAGLAGEAAALLPEFVKAALEIGRPIGLLKHRRLVTVSGGWDSTEVGVEAPLGNVSLGLGAARSPFELALYKALDDWRHVRVEPRLEHRPEHLQHLLVSGLGALAGRPGRSLAGRREGERWRAIGGLSSPNHIALLVDHVDQVEHVIAPGRLGRGRGRRWGQGRCACVRAPPAALALRDDPADRLQDLLLR